MWNGATDAEVDEAGDVEGPEPGGLIVSRPSKHADVLGATPADYHVPFRFRTTLAPEGAKREQESPDPAMLPIYLPAGGGPTRDTRVRTQERDGHTDAEQGRSTPTAFERLVKMVAGGACTEASPCEALGFVQGCAGKGVIRSCGTGGWKPP